MVADRGAEFCGLLTAHGQARVFSIPVESPVAPRGCERVIDLAWRADSQDGLNSWRADASGIPGVS